MACGNNMISRSGLQSPPTEIKHPAPVRVEGVARQHPLGVARDVVGQVTQAQQAVKHATTDASVKSALRSAEQALEAARRGSRNAQAKSALRSLERQVDELRRDAAAKQHDIAARLHHESALHARITTASFPDPLSPMQLGVAPKVVRASARDPDLETGPPDAALVVDSHAVFEFDHIGRTVRAVTVLDQLAVKTERNKGHQVAAGGADRLATDDGGHIFATLFGGLGEGINIQPMDFSINRGKYRELERLWARHIEQGGLVNVEVVFHFTGESRRPDQFDVTFDLGDGESVSIPFYQ